MKKWISLTLIAAMLVSFSGCCLIHQWEPSNCVSPMTCSKCGKTEGEAIGHSISDWEVVKESTYAEPGLMQKKCYVCGQVLQESPLETSPLSGELFVFSRGDYLQQLEKVLKEYSDSMGVLDMDSYVCATTDSVDMLVYFLRYNEPLFRKKDAPLYADRILFVFANDNFRSVYLAVLIESLCTGISEDVLEVGVEKLNNGENFIHNGICFSNGTYDDYPCVEATAENFDPEGAQEINGGMLYDEEGKRRSAFDFVEEYGRFLSATSKQVLDATAKVVKDSSSAIHSYFIEIPGSSCHTMINFAQNGDFVSESGAFDQINMMSTTVSASDAVNFSLYAGLMIYAVDPSVGDPTECVQLAVDLMNEITVENSIVEYSANGITYRFNGAIISETMMILGLAIIL